MYTGEEANNRLKTLLMKGSVVYAQTLVITEAGQRSSFYTVYNGDIVKLDHLILSFGLGKKYRDQSGVYLKGKQMDLEEHLVMTLGQFLFGDDQSLRMRKL